MSDKETYESNPRSAWDVYSSKKHRNAMHKLAKEYIDFLNAGKTEREVIDYAIEMLEDNGFTPDMHSRKCFKVFKGKNLFIARQGKKPLTEGFRLVGAHADSPRLDLKQHPLYEDVQLGLAKTHYYGGIRKYQWLARPLALHGVVVKRDGEVVKVVIGENESDPVLMIDDLLPHLAAGQNEKTVAKAFEAEKLNVIFCHEPAAGDDKDKDRVKKHLLRIFNERYGIVEDDFYSAELQVVPADRARFVGLDESMIGGYGHDDRACCFTALKAILDADQPEYTQIVMLWDKEEIGSDGSTGAQSLFFEYCLEDLMDAWNEEGRLSRVMLNGKALSADVAAPADPNNPEVHDKLNAARFGYGPSFSKFTGSRGKYGANDAHPEYVAWVRNILDEAGVPWQMAELGKVDQGGGGTVAKHLAVYGMDIIDVGPPVLSMHSPFELLSKADLYATKLAYETFLKK